MRLFFLLSFLMASAAFAAPTTIELPKGRWARKAENGAHLVFRGLTNAVVEATGCDLVCGDIATAVLFEDCAEVTLRGLSVDYDPLPFSEGRVERVDADGTLHVRLAQGYPDTRRLSLFKGQLYSAEGELLPPRGGFTDLRKTGPETLTVKWRGSGKVAPGCIFVTDVEAVPFNVFARNPDNTAMRFHAVLKKNCRNVRFEGVTVYASHWFGFYEKDCEGSVFENCAVCPRDQKDDPVKRGLPRLRATNADGFHLRRASGRPQLLNCRVDGTEDDMLNIHGDFHFVTQGDSSAWRVLSQDRFNIAPGDQVEVVPSGGGKRFFAKVRSVKPDGMVTDEERRRLSGVEMRAYFRWHWVPEACLSRRTGGGTAGRIWLGDRFVWACRGRVPRQGVPFRPYPLPGRENTGVGRNAG